MSQLIYQQSSFPTLQNRVYDTFDEAKNCLVGDIALVEDDKTGLIHNKSFNPDFVKYDVHYNNEQGNSNAFREHLKQVGAIVKRILGTSSLIEIGCGKGLFLEQLLLDGVDITGFDPTYEGGNTRVVKQFFGPGLETEATGIVLRHVLEHIPNPLEFLKFVRDANGGSGLVYIEVPCFDWIIENKSWVDIFYEHVNYFRISDFCRMFGSPVEYGRLFGGQYIYVVADLSRLRSPVYDPSDRVDFPKNFLASLQSVRSKSQSPQEVVWGGGSKGVIFTLMKMRMGERIDCVVDINPRKQGKFLPVSGVRISSPIDGLKMLDPGAIIHVMNPNYLDEVSEIGGSDFAYSTKL